MKTLRGAVWASAVVVLALEAMPARAAWDNVFQICCHRHRAPATASYFYAAPSPCCEPCAPQPVCTTRYVQRCYYQPVTCYQTKTYYEPVTTYRTSYYYEPVTSYRYSCYYDPCSCRYQQVACPTTSYQLRSQCCPVQSWVQRCCSVPVTSYQQSFYWEPVTTCCTPACPPACPTGLSASALPAPDCGSSAAPAATPSAPAGVTEQRIPPVPGVSEYPSRSSSEALPYNRYYPPTSETSPPASGSSIRQPIPQTGLPYRPTAPAPAVRLDRITALPSGDVSGQVVESNQAPRAGVRILFVSTDLRGPRETASTDASGQFRASLTTGDWLVYVDGADGKPVFHRKIAVGTERAPQMLLVSR